MESFRFLGTTISQDLKWDIHIDSIVKKAQQRLYFLRQLRKFNLPQELLKQFYSAIIESVLCTSVTVWFSSATKSDLKRLRRVVRTRDVPEAEYLIRKGTDNGFKTNNEFIRITEKIFGRHNHMFSGTALH